ncbi:MAG: hypothetical protein ACFFD3_05280 [Candidatus Thorarchaeota archaeon]
MDPFVIQVLPEQIDELRVALLDSDNTHASRVTSKYEAFRFYYSDGLIIGYTSGKVVANTKSAAGLLQRAAKTLERIESDIITIGSDEAGKGEWLGPLTIAAVALTEEQAAHLRSMGVMDSKELSSGTIGELAHEIESHSVAIHTVLIPPKTFEERLKTMHSEGKNLNDLLAWGHSTVIESVFKKVKKTSDIRIVIDEFDRAKMKDRLGQKLNLKDIELIQKHRAESITAVAAASIMARDLRDDWIDKASLRLGFELEGMSIKEALKRKEIAEFAKLSFLKSGQR